MSGEKNKALIVESRNKPVVSSTSGENVSHQVRFEPKRFNSLIFDKGYEVFIDKALRCPCSVKGTGGSLVTCNNCLGIGWIYIDRKETRIAIQQMKADVRYENWTQTTAGMAKITARAVDKLAFMDRIVLREVEGYFNEIARAREHMSNQVLFLLYEPLEIESIYLFNGDKQPLNRLNSDEYTVDGYMIKLSDKYNSVKNITATVRYRHLLTYHMVDMNRDIMKVRTKECSLRPEQLESMAISGMARKAHYIFDNIKYDEEMRLIENSKKVEDNS